ncbi:LacI family DNA-binding transcriptional regulator [Pectobacterium polaris]|uniref:LacI family DNA-binding transcriptional regulator n=1 Tax=Pectobacterium TaxID=122277 RepID=UPI000E75F4AE|nr:MULTISPECIES: LacI family DNA-binding transcriptional regulator [Pectobacterium]MCY9847898.1 LacI family DNA-binding transcriptional regulator [Pectobacterium jejuense]MDE8744279.1 LacI family DNA-binding transcriptional regulator [Pectobacterium polaris]MDE8757354.1 LacI family DNA-binding transcriptional regulator [Pectobacterium polaris]RJL26889.1 LacI family DNA-binding transcriptional regulator [Pectobacterium polaris]UMO86842.1 LacI family DNA-binding transcriptional regulator [Pectob
MVSLKDVAQLAGVSMMTVSRVLNHPDTVRPETRKRVMQAVQTLNYIPDHSARKIRTQRNSASTIAILARDTATTPFSVEILLAIEQTAREKGWNSFLINIFSEQDSERAVRQLLAQRPDGIIYTTMGLRHVTLPDVLKGENVILANCQSDDKSLPAYIPNNFDAQYQATRYLIDRGYQKPLCFWLPDAEAASRDRRNGFEHAWQTAGRSLSDTSQHHMMLGDEHYTDLAELLAIKLKDNHPDFDVLICGNDRIAFIAYQVLLAHGIAIPEQVAVLGFDNQVGMGNLFLPPLSTIQLPHDEIGRQATLHIIENRENGGCQQLPCPLLIRSST